MFLVFWGCSGFSGECSWFSGGVPGFLGGVPGFLGGVPGFWECSGFLGGVPGFLGGVPGLRWCSGFFGCSGVPVFPEVLHALFVAVSEVKMSRQTTLGRFGF